MALLPLLLILFLAARTYSQPSGSILSWFEGLSNHSSPSSHSTSSTTNLNIEEEYIVEEQQPFTEEQILLPHEGILIIDNKTCINDPNCHQNVTYCMSEGCCGVKVCTAGGICSVAIPQCTPPPVQEEEEIQVIIEEETVLVQEFDNKTCISTQSCHRDATFCPYAGCCAKKTCDENEECSLDVPHCILAGPSVTPGEEAVISSEEETIVVDDQACLSDDNCKRNVTYCISQTCCAVKQCFEGGFCALIQPPCFSSSNTEQITEEQTIISPNENSNTLPDTSSRENLACIEDPSCQRNVTFCIYQGCCASKTCDYFGSCSIQSPEQCPPPQLTPEQTANASCIQDPNCAREASYCLYEGCCAVKTCGFSGCSVQISDCSLTSNTDSTGATPQTTVANNNESDEACITDPNCKRNAMFCISETCCAYKTCDASGICQVTIPQC